MDSSRPYKVCNNEREAQEFAQDQEDRLRNRNLHRLFEVGIEPITHTKDGYVNGQGPWGVYLRSKL